jgi:methyltransferase (TIGR00027 family)
MRFLMKKSLSSLRPFGTGYFKAVGRRVPSLKSFPFFNFSENILKQIPHPDSHPPSLTTLVVCYLRAVGNHVRYFKGFSDPIAEKFLPEDYLKNVSDGQAHLQQDGTMAHFFQESVKIVEFRTTVIDEAIKEALPFDQLVILSAGVDSRAWRLKELAQVDVFEVDRSEAQEWKKEKAKDIQPTAKSVTFVPADIQRDNLADCLKKHNFKTDAKTFWVMEGVSMYLTKEEVKKTLTTISQLSPGQGRVALTYLETDEGEIGSLFSLFMRTIGEPIKSTFPFVEFRRLKQENGKWKKIAYFDIKNDLHSSPFWKKLLGTSVFERIFVGKNY